MVLLIYQRVIFELNFLSCAKKQVIQYENAQNVTFNDTLKSLTPTPEAVVKEIIVEGYLEMTPRK
jgi:hypothetical protein